MMMRQRLYFLLPVLMFIGLGCGSKTPENLYTGVLEGKAVQVPALTPGKILGLFVAEGDWVQPGDTLAVIDTTELSYQFEQLQGKRQELQIRMEIARNNRKRAKSDLAYIQRKYDRIVKLYRTNSAPKQTVDDLSNQLQRARSAYSTANQNVRTLEALQQQLEAQIKTLRKKIRDAVITSPIQGMVTSKYFEAGEAVPPMTPIVELMHTQTVEVKIYLSEKRLPKIKVNQNVTVYVDGLDTTFTGRIAWISPRAEFTPKSILTPETRTSLVYAVKVVIENPDGVLKHGMPVEVKL